MTRAERLSRPSMLQAQADPATNRYRYRVRYRYRNIMAFPVCGRRLSAGPAQAGTGREHEIQKNDFDRVSAMSTRLGGRGYLGQEDRLPSNREWTDSDSDPDSDSEKNESSSSDGSLPCQIHPIARLSFRGSSTTVVSLSRNLRSIFCFSIMIHDRRLIGFTHYRRES